MDRAADARRCWASARRPPAAGTELFAAWRTFFERLAETGTVAFVVEDLQWSDDGLLDFLEHLLDWGRSSPIFVLTLARPELLERRPGWGTDRRGAMAMRLDPLTDAAMRELLDGIAPDLPAKVVARILERADGLPLYAVETIRMMVATGRLAQEGGRVVDDQPNARPPTNRAPSRCRRPCMPSSRPGSTGCRPPTGRSSRTPPCSARRSPSKRSPRSPERRPTRSSRVSTLWSARRS